MSRTGENMAESTIANQSMVLGLVAGAFSAAIIWIAVAVVELPNHALVALPLLAAGAWGAFSVSQLWARYQQCRRILREHGLLPIL
jgi:hypothetical protein